MRRHDPKDSPGRDLARVGVALLVAAPHGFLPNLLVSGALWGGDPVGAHFLLDFTLPLSVVLISV